MTNANRVNGLNLMPNDSSLLLLRKLRIRETILTEIRITSVSKPKQPETLKLLFHYYFLCIYLFLK